jgi:hypothetical protein
MFRQRASPKGNRFRIVLALAALGEPFSSMHMIFVLDEQVLTV